MNVVDIGAAFGAAFGKAKTYVDSVVAALANGFHYKGTVATVDDLPIDAEDGDLYTVSDSGGSYVWDGTEWRPTGIRGIQGEKGETGEQGNPGRDGAIQYTAGTGISIDPNTHVISNTQTSAEWGNIEGNLNDQTDLYQSLGAKADLIGGKIPLIQLPDFIVADVVQVATYEDLPQPGASNTLYYVISTQTTYRWVGDDYVAITQKNQYFSLVVDATTMTMQDLKDIVDGVNNAGDHVFFDLHSILTEGYVCTVHFWTESNENKCEINDLLNDRLYGVHQTWTGSELVSAYCSIAMYDVKQVKVNGTIITNDRGVVDIVGPQIVYH